MATTIRGKAEKCPTCEQVQDALANADDQDTAPKPGDFIICFGCQDIFVLGAELQPVKPTEKQIAKMPLDVLSACQREITKIKNGPE